MVTFCGEFFFQSGSSSNKVRCENGSDIEFLLSFCYFNIHICHECFLDIVKMYGLSPFDPNYRNTMKNHATLCVFCPYIQKLYLFQSYSYACCAFCSKIDEHKALNQHLEINQGFSQAVEVHDLAKNG